MAAVLAVIGVAATGRAQELALVWCQRSRLESHDPDCLGDLLFGQPGNCDLRDLVLVEAHGCHSLQARLRVQVEKLVE